MRCNKGEVFNGTLTFCLVVATVVFILVSIPSKAHADEADELYKVCISLRSKDSDGDYRRALNSCSRLIERYSVDLRRRKLGHVYYNRGDTKSHFKQYASAVSDYRRAIELGYPGGYNGLGKAYWKGKGVPEDERRAKELFKKGCDMEDIGSCFALEVLKIK